MSEIKMFCNQCQETAKGTGCEIKGVCGKNYELSNLMDVLIYTMKGVSEIVVKAGLDAKNLQKTNHQMMKGLFMTITNANFDDELMERQINVMLSLRDEVRKLAGDSLSDKKLHEAATFQVNSREEMLKLAPEIGILATDDEDIRSLHQMIIYGLKGMSAYTEHALNLGKENHEICQFIYKALAATNDESLTVDDFVKLTLETGEYGVKAMALLDEANTSAYGNPEITEVNLGVRNNPAILISGHDLKDLEQLLDQTKGTGVDVYTHSEMLPAHSYPFFKKYDNLVGNYGSSWWKQIEEFETFKGPILFTTNCLVPPKSDEVASRIFASNAAGYPGCPYIEADENGFKDFSPIIEMAKKLPPPQEIETGKIVAGFAHAQVLALADKVIDGVKSGAIKKFFVMGGCDGRFNSREYYTEFAKRLPEDCIILTAGCAKYRYNKLDLGNINGIPRVLDAGQCNDSYSLVLIALALKDAFQLNDINELPIVYNIAWYEQKAVIVLLALLYLGVKDIHLGPTLPGFLSPNVAKVLVENFGIAGIGKAIDDVKMMA